MCAVLLANIKIEFSIVITTELINELIEPPFSLALLSFKVTLQFPLKIIVEFCTHKAPPLEYVAVLLVNITSEVSCKVTLELFPKHIAPHFGAMLLINL